VNKDKFKGRPFRDEDVQIITEEVTYLVKGGYRPNDKTAILEGLDAALDTVHADTWKRWTTMKLMHVIDELYAIGTR